MINDISVYYYTLIQFTNKLSIGFVPTHHSLNNLPPHQKMDSWVIVVNNSSAFMPLTELPLLFRRGLHTATE